MGGIIDSTTLITGFTIQNGFAQDYINQYDDGGGIYLYSSSPTLTNITFNNNTADFGGGMYLRDSSNPTLTDITFSDNTAAFKGGGMRLLDSSPTLTDVTFNDNTADFGGGMYLTSSSSTLTDVTFSDNIANNGGGMRLNQSSPTLTNVTFSGNIANNGGGMYLTFSSPTLTDVTFNDNTAEYDGGGMDILESSPTLIDVTFSNNSAGSGGGMYLRESNNPILTDVTFSDNIANNGGGMRLNQSSPTLTNVTFSGNIANNGGGMDILESSPTLIDVTFSGNSAVSSGAGIYVDAATVTITDSKISNNSAGNKGGGIYLENSFAEIINSEINYNNSSDFNGTGNEVHGGGGGIYSYESNLSLINSDISYNNSYYGGGAICSYGGWGDSSLDNCTIKYNTTYVNAASAIYVTDATGSEIWKNFYINDSFFLYNGLDGNQDTQLNPIISIDRYNEININSSTFINGDYQYSIRLGDNFSNISVSNSIFKNEFYEYSPNNDGTAPISGYVNENNQVDFSYSLASIDNFNSEFESFINGEGNLFNTNPLFTDPDNGDYTLQPSSPCIDAGDPASEYDPDGTIADMGAFYFDQIENPINYGCMDSEATNYNQDATIDDGSCFYCDLGDVNCDGSLNVLDIVIAANMVLADEYDEIADMNEDGELNILDLVIMVNLVLYGDAGACIDIDGNVYETVQIGDQLWMAENLKVTHYNDGSEIPTGYSNSEWGWLDMGAYAVYDDDPVNADVYGNLYNWFAVDDSRGICPDGFHVPSDEEFMELEMYLGMSESEASSMGWRGTNEGSKLAGNSGLWENGDLENNSEFGMSGFSAFPAGYRYDSNGSYYSMGEYGYFWQSSEYASHSGWGRLLSYSYSNVARGSNYKQAGFSIRCVAD